MSSRHQLTDRIRALEPRLAAHPDLAASFHAVSTVLLVFYCVIALYEMQFLVSCMCVCRQLADSFVFCALLQARNDTLRPIDDAVLLHFEGELMQREAREPLSELVLDKRVLVSCVCALFASRVRLFALAPLRSALFSASSRSPQCAGLRTAWYDGAYIGAAEHARRPR